MSRNRYVILSLLPFLILGVMMGADKLSDGIFPYALGIAVASYIFLYIMRLKYLKLSTKEILISFIPIIGWKYSYRRYTDK